MKKQARRLFETFRDRELWATWLAGIAWTILAVLGAGIAAVSVVTPYGIFAAPFTAMFALLAAYFAVSVWVRRRLLVANAAFLTSLPFAALWLAVGAIPIGLAASIPVALSALSAWQIRKHDIGAVQMGVGPEGVMSQAGIARRVVVALLIVAILAGGFWWAAAFGPLNGCRADGPNELPSGTTPGQGIERVDYGAKQVVWGKAGDRIEEIVGLTFFSAEDPDSIFVSSFDIHGHPGVLYQLTSDESPGQGLAFSWSEEGCDLTVFLAPGMSIEHAESYAARY